MSPPAPCRAGFARNGQISPGTDAIPPCNLLTTKPVRAADVRSMRLRTGAPLYAGFVATPDGEPVQMPASELFESLSQGDIADTFGANHGIIANRPGDIIHYVEGVFNGAAQAASSMLWMQLDADQKSEFDTWPSYSILPLTFGLVCLIPLIRLIEVLIGRLESAPHDPLDEVQARTAHSPATAH